jgi:hypothetical protein
MMTSQRYSLPRDVRRRLPAFAVLFVVACCGAAAAGVLIARRESAQAYDEPAPRFTALGRLVPRYPDSHFFPMGESIMVAGIGRELGYALTTDSTRKVADYYEAIWRSQGFKVDRRNGDCSDDGDQRPAARCDEEWVSATDLRDPWMRSVLVTRRAGTTVIVATVRDLSRPSAPSAVPISSACDVVGDDAATDRGVRTQQLLVSCRAHLDDVLDYYDGALQGAARRTHLGADGSADTAYITYSEANREVRLMAKEGEPDSDGQPRTAVSLTWQEGR